MKKINTLFVVTEMRLGGREKVTKEVAEALNEITPTEIFSVWKKPSFFDLDLSLTYGDGITVDVNKTTESQSRMIETVKKNIVIPTVKKIMPYSVMQFKRMQTLSAYIQNHNIKNVVLTDLTMTFASFLKKNNPDTNLIGWIHMDCEHFFKKQYVDYRGELIKSFAALDDVVTLTQDQANAFSSYLKKDVIAIPNPMPNETKYKADLSKKNIVVVSRIDIIHKGLDMLLEVATRLPAGWTISIAGKAQTAEEEQKFMSMIDKAGLNETVKLEGALLGDALDGFYASGSMFLMTSRFEGFPLTLGEAMAHGLPVISFDMDGSRTITDNGKYGILVEMGDIDAMSQQVRRMAENHTERVQYAQKGRERVKAFSIDKIDDQWLKILQDVNA